MIVISERPCISLSDRSGRQEEPFRKFVLRSNSRQGCCCCCFIATAVMGRLEHMCSLAHGIAAAQQFVLRRKLCLFPVTAASAQVQVGCCFCSASAFRRNSSAAVAPVQPGCCFYFASTFRRDGWSGTRGLETAAAHPLPRTAMEAESHLAPAECCGSTHDRQG